MLRLHMERGTSLPRRISELVILVVARHFSAELAWCRHRPQALEAGLDANVIDAIGDGEVPEFANSDEGAAFELACELLTTSGISDSNYARALNIFGQDASIELATVVGYGCLLSFAINCFEADTLPVDGCVLPPGKPPHTACQRPQRPPRIPDLLDSEMNAEQRALAAVIAATRHGHVRGPFAI